MCYNNNSGKAVSSLVTVLRIVCSLITYILFGGTMDNKSFAILGLVLSIVTGIPGLIVSAIALKKFKDSGSDDGKVFAIIGLVLGIIYAASVLLGFCLCGGALCAGIAAGS